MGQYLVDFLNVFQGVRKSVVMLAIIAITAIFRAKGLVSGDNFENLLKATVIAYFGSNSIEHYTAMVKERITAKGKEKIVTDIQSVGAQG